MSRGIFGGDQDSKETESCQPCSSLHCGEVDLTGSHVTYRDASHSEGPAGTDSLLLLPFQQHHSQDGRQLFTTLNVK